MKRCLGIVTVLLAGWFSAPWTARAQAPESRIASEQDRNQSHVPIEFEGRDFNQDLLKRFNGLRQKNDFAKQLLKGDRKALEELKDLARDPKFLGSLEQELNAQRSVIPPERFKQLQETLKKAREQSMALGSNDREPPAASDAASQDSRNNATPGKQLSRARDRETSPGGSANEPADGPPGKALVRTRSGLKTIDSLREQYAQSPSQSDQSTPEQRLTRWLRRNLDVNKGPLAESQAVRDAMRELRKGRASSETAAEENGWIGQVAKFSQGLEKNEWLSKIEWPKLGKWQLPSSRGLPKVSSPFSAPSFRRMPTVGLPSATTIDRGLQLVWIALIIAAGVLVWKLLGGYVPGISRQRRRQWHLGPWPVAPDAVGTRQDLVRAFEYLSLLKLGPAAYSRNHRDLAAELGEPETESLGAAERLASLYEKARYTPPEETLSSDALSSARRELAYLAGVKSA